MNHQKLAIHPSILSADFGNLAAEAKALEEAGADAIHVDIMDGHFVPNLTLGPKAVAAIRKATKLPLDVHLMIYQPFDYVETFIHSGADHITFHLEATEDIEDTLKFIRTCGKTAGLSIRPETPVSMVFPFLPLCDLILLMTVNPGFGGQAFMPEVLDKVEELKAFCDDQKLGIDIQVDGGIDAKTAPLCKVKGANVLVSGNYLYQQPSLKEGILSLKADA